MKIEVFREMYELNEAFERIMEGLRRLEKYPFLCRELVQGTRAEAVVLQVKANECFFDKFERIVGDDARWAYKFLSDTRERLKDPEDVYLEFKHREVGSFWNMKTKKRPGKAAPAIEETIVQTTYAVTIIAAKGTSETNLESPSLRKG